MRRSILVVASSLTLVVGLIPAAAQAEDAVAVVTPPSISGSLTSGTTLTLDPGRFDPADAATSIVWRRDGRVVPGRTGTTYLLGRDDVEHQLRADVTASAPGHSSVTASSPTTAAVHLPSLHVSSRPVIRGTSRYGSTLVARGLRWGSTKPTSVRYRWLRDGRDIAGATKSSHRIQPGDVGHRISVRVAGRRSGYETTVTASNRTRTVRHRVDVRRTVTYSVVRDGRTLSDFDTFVRQSAQTYADARGWRGAGIRFKRVSSGGDFTLVLAAASRLPRYSSECSSDFSCRVGRHVVINESRWRLATRVWRDRGRSIRDYRHMVVNHETGHWFGKQHAGCAVPGSSAPVMQQQSKGLQGCHTNPWPLRSELGLPRYGWPAP